MTQTTGGYSTEQLREELDSLALSSFSAADAVALGQLATDRAIEAGLPIVIEVDHLGRLAYRAEIGRAHV